MPGRRVNGTHGFVRSPSGEFALFDPLGSTLTEPYRINFEGAITGDYFGVISEHGFVRAADGTITTFDVPNSSGTGGSAINDRGVVTGGFVSGGKTLGFLRVSRPK
jgi:hypothetical protein